MWNLALEQVGDNMFPHHISDNIVRISFTISGAPALISTSGEPGCQVENKTCWLTPADLCIGGCLCAAAPHRHSRFNFFSLLPPFGLVLMVQSQLRQCTDTFAYSPLGVRVLPLERDGQMRKEGHISLSNCLASEREGNCNHAGWCNTNEAHRPNTLPVIFTVMLLMQQHWKGGVFHICYLFTGGSILYMFQDRYLIMHSSPALCLFPFNHPSSDKRLISTQVKLHSSSLDKETYTKVMTARGQAGVLTPSSKFDGRDLALRPWKKHKIRLMAHDTIM